MSFSVTSAHVCVVLIYFFHPFVGVGAHGWVVDTGLQVASSKNIGLNIGTIFQKYRANIGKMVKL